MKNMKKIIAVLMSLSAITMTTSAFARTNGSGEATYDAESGAVSLSTEQLPTDAGKQLTVVIVPTTVGEKSITSADIYYINQGAAGTEFAGIIEAMKVKDGADFATNTYEVRIGGALANDYYVYEITGKALEEIIYGDVNGDKVADGLDALDVLKFSVKLMSFTDAQINAGEVTGDGVTDGLDALDILKYSVKLIPSFNRK